MGWRVVSGRWELCGREARSSAEAQELVDAGAELGVEV